MRKLILVTSAVLVVVVLAVSAAGRAFEGTAERAKKAGGFVGCGYSLNK